VFPPTLETPLLVLLILHAVLAVAGPAAAGRFGRGVFPLMALAPAATSVWAAVQATRVLDGRPVTSTTQWVPGLSLTLDLRLDALSLLLTSLVAGVGTLVLLYCTRYFEAGDASIGRFAGVLTAFAGSMLGLVLADDVLLLYMFWELTSVTSWLLIGHDDTDPDSRRSAQQTLLITTFGGLAMLVGLIVLSTAAGTTSLSGMLAAPPTGTSVAVGLALVLVGAFTKSAQVPFHPWLPSAMAAPTPVSAYLHAAAMVKAGVYLVARLAPAFAAVALWRPLVLTVGLATMVVGGWRALRQSDLKRVLAFGTVSQLGFLMVLLGAGTREAALAGATVLLAHGLFKSTLFLTVGAVDHATGTRDLRLLSGVGRQQPVLATAAALAALSMAGLPPLLGFIGKEEAYAAFLEDPVVLVGLVGGSVLTVAYSARFWWGAFASKKGCAPTPAHHTSGWMLGPVALLGALGLVLALVPSLPDPLVQAYASAYGEPGKGDYLALWHGLNPELALSVLTVLLGAGLFAVREPFRSLQRTLSRAALGRLDADRSYDATLTGLTRLSLRATAIVQSGSLPVYLGTVLLTLVVLPGSALVATSSWPTDARLFDRPLQAAVAATIVVAALATARAHRRFTAVLTLGAVGYGIAVLFVLQGAPDLALTQFLIETLSLVLFVFVLRRMPSTFRRHPGRLNQAARFIVALSVGIFVGVAVLLMSQARTQPPISQAYLDRSLTEAGGRNVVNVILVDFRGFDTLGEITVLAVAVMGVATLVRASRERTTGRPDGATALTAADGEPDQPEDTAAREPVAR